MPILALTPIIFMSTTPSFKRAGQLKNFIFLVILISPAIFGKKQGHFFTPLLCSNGVNGD